MRSLFAVLRRLVLPAGAPPGTPKLVLGPDLPPPLDTYVFFGLAKASTAVIWYAGTAGDDDYTFLAQVSAGGAQFVHMGQVFNGAVVESYTGNPVGQSWLLTAAGNGSISFYLASANGSDFNLKLSEFSADVVMNPLALSRGYRRANLTDNGTVVTTVGAAEIAVPSAAWDVEPTYNLMNGRMYKATVQGYYIESSGAGGVASVIRMRQGAATITGNLLGQNVIFHQAGVGGFTGSFSTVFYFQNASAGQVNTKLSLTIQRAAGAGNISLYGDAAQSLEIVVEDIGARANYADTLTLQTPSV